MKIKRGPRKISDAFSDDYKTLAKEKPVNEDFNDVKS